MRFPGGMKSAALTAVAAVIAVGAAMPFVELPMKSLGKGPDILSILHDRSPEERAAGAQTNKAAKVSMKLPAAKPVAAKAPVMPAAPATSAVLPVAAAPAAPPMTFVPAAAAAAPAALIPAAAASGSKFFIPPLIIPGGSSHHTTVIPPTGGSNPPPPVPGVPEPATWAMMMVGFGLLGAFLRRQRRVPGQRSSSAAAGDAANEAGALQRV